MVWKVIYGYGLIQDIITPLLHCQLVKYDVKGKLDFLGKSINSLGNIFLTLYLVQNTIMIYLYFVES